MKKFLFISIFCLFLNYSYGEIIKFQTGTNLSKLDFNILGANYFEDIYLNYPVFLGIDYLENKHYNLETNIGLVTKGGIESFDKLDEEGEKYGEAELKAKLKYISINTLINFNFTSYDKFIPFISIGPFYEYLIDYNKYFDTFKETDVLNKNSFGLLLGGGIKYDLNKIQLGIRTDYYFNLNKVANWKKGKDFGQDGNIKKYTTSINISIGYRL